jgi:hypothetical protein
MKPGKHKQNRLKEEENNKNKYKTKIKDTDN